MLMGLLQRRLPLEYQQPHDELRDDQDCGQKTQDDEKRFHRRTFSFRIEKSSTRLVFGAQQNIEERPYLQLATDNC